MPVTVLPRSKVNQKYTWNSESLCPSAKAWEDEVNQIIADIPALQKYQGQLSKRPAILLAAMNAIEQLTLRAYRAFVYAGFTYAPVQSTANRKS